MIENVVHQGTLALALRTRAVEAIVPLEYGPRVISLRSLARGGNIFHEFPDGAPAGHEGLLLRGGHRFWHAPEDMVRTYQPDNDAPVAKTSPRGVSLTQAVEPKTGLQKQVSVEVVGERTLKVTHKLTNRALWPVEAAPWALSVVRRGGVAVVGFPPRGTHADNLLPSYSIVPWNYTDFSLPVWKFHREFLAVDTTKATGAQKVGLTSYPGWAAYWIGGVTFVKTAAVQPGAAYPDRGCPFELYCNDTVLELETLGPLAPLAPGKTVTHVEHWGVLDGLPKPASDRVWGESFAPAVAKWLKTVR